MRRRSSRCAPPSRSAPVNTTCIACRGAAMWIAWLSWRLPRRSRSLRRLQRDRLPSSLLRFACDQSRHGTVSISRCQVRQLGGRLTIAFDHVVDFAHV